jgi:hypothetical protein
MENIGFNKLLNRYPIQLIVVEVHQQDNIINLEWHVLQHKLVKVFYKINNEKLDRRK